MFGADTPLVLDALQMAAVAAIAGGGAIWLIVRRKARKDASLSTQTGPGELEQRVRVLERIAVDRSSDLADEIDALREGPETSSAPERAKGAAQ